MSVIDYGPQTRVLVSVKGHPYPRDAFFGMLESLEGMTFTAVEQPASQAFLSPAGGVDWDAFLFYDMPGIDFSTQPPQLVAPPAALKEGLMALLEQGRGCVFLHHAIAGWPLWPEYADIVGGRFPYLPGELRGRPRVDSGYRHDVNYRARVVADHPLTDGVEGEFAVTDELYLYEVLALSSTCSRVMASWPMTTRTSADCCTMRWPGLPATRRWTGRALAMPSPDGWAARGSSSKRKGERRCNLGLRRLK